MKTFLSIFLILSNLIFSQKQFSFNIDFAKFQYDKTSDYLEIYYYFNQKNLEIKENDSIKNISLTFKISLMNSQNEKIINESFNLDQPVNSALNENESYVGVVSYRIPCGEYNLEITANDNNSENKNEKIIKKLFAECLAQNVVSISDIELAGKIVQEDADPNSIYYKNGLEVIPNPTLLYGESNPILYYYFELYNNIDADKKYFLERKISFGNEIIDNKIEEINFINSSILKAGIFNLAKYGSGKYKLQVNIVDSLKNIIASSSKDFYNYNSMNDSITNVAATNAAYIQSFFGVLSEEECDHEFKMAKYIATENEKDDYADLKDLETKRKYLFSFWKKRDANPLSEKNEFYDLYKERLNYVQENYGHRHKKGYKTDRGRVVLLYGKPDRVETRSNEADLKPYEVWSYNSMEGGVLFIFGDTMGISEYELLHSTKRGELFDPNWESRLRLVGTAF